MLECWIFSDAFSTELCISVTVKGRPLTRLLEKWGDFSHCFCRKLGSGTLAACLVPGTKGSVPRGVEQLQFANHSFPCSAECSERLELYLCETPSLIMNCCTSWTFSLQFSVSWGEKKMYVMFLHVCTGISAWQNNKGQVLSLKAFHTVAGITSSCRHPVVMNETVVTQAVPVKPLHQYWKEIYQIIS